MKRSKTTGVILAAALTLGLSTFVMAQDSGTKQDMKNAGSETKDAAKDTGSAIKHGSKKVYHKTRRGMHKMHRKMDPDTPTTTTTNGTTPQ